MAYHYNAFISYNHNPRDMKIARLLQQKLERYKLPKDASSEGPVCIERVFLDKGELEVAGDLNKVIQEALENSDYLIVICSPEGKGSIWVQREMEFFLRNHDLDRILTVITEGEPSEVLPDLILYEDVVDENTGKTERVFREPLSCDYRLPVSKANREELPRLAAALIGCRYDDLVQRQRTYRMKRQIAVLAAAAVVLTAGISYLVWSNHQINTNYENSLREQSLNLAMQSSGALGRGDRVGAIELALEALPDSEGSRPVVSEAVLALSEALDLYRTPDDEHWASVRQYDYGKSHKKVIPFSSSGGTDCLADLCSDGRLRIWDVVSRTEVMAEYTDSLFDSGTLPEMIFVSDDRDLILITENSLISLDVSKGKENYNVRILSEDDESGDARLYAYEECICGKGNTLCVPACTPSGKKLLVIDLSNGKALHEIPADETPSKIRISDDGGYIAALYNSTGYRDNNLIAVYDTSTGESVQTVSRVCAYDMLFDGEDRLVICGFTETPENFDNSINTSFNYISGEKNFLFSTSADHTVTLSCCDVRSGAELWNTEKEKMYSGTPWLDKGSPGSLYEGDIICTTGCDAMICDADGLILNELDFRSPVVCYDHKKNMLRAILQNGCMAYYRQDENALNIVENTFLSPVYDACYDKDASGSRVFITTTDNVNSMHDNYILQYEYRGSDSKWKDYPAAESAYDNIFVMAADAFDDRFLEVSQIYSADGNAGLTAHVEVRDIKDGSVLMEKDVTVGEADAFSGFHYAGTNEDRTAIRLISLRYDDRSALVTVDLDSGKTGAIPVTFSADPSEKEGVVFTEYELIDNTGVDAGAGKALHDGKLYFPVIKTVSESGSGQFETTYSLVVLSIDPESGKAEESFVCGLEEKPGPGTDWAVAYDPACGTLVIVDEAKQISSYDLGGEKQSVSDPLDFFPEAIAVTDGGNVIALDGSDASDCVLHVYGSGAGDEIASAELGNINISSGTFMDHSLLPDETSMMLTLEHTAFILDRNDWSVKSRIISRYVAFDPDNSTFILGSSYGREYGRVPYRTLEDMIREGNEEIGSSQ